MTGEPKLLFGDVDMSFAEAMERCIYRGVCTPRAMDAEEKVVLTTCVTLIGPPRRLPDDLVHRLWENVTAGRCFLVATDREDMLKHVLHLVDQMAAQAYLANTPVAGRA